MCGGPVGHKDAQEVLAASVPFSHVSCPSGDPEHSDNGSAMVLLGCLRPDCQRVPGPIAVYEVFPLGEGGSHGSKGVVGHRWPMKKVV